MLLPEVEEFYFDGNKKHQALKVLEEASELVEAVKSGDKEHAQEELMDTIQACANLIARQEWTKQELEEAYVHVHESNENKGRYDIPFSFDGYDEDDDTIYAIEDTEIDSFHTGGYEPYTVTICAFHSEEDAESYLIDLGYHESSVGEWTIGADSGSYRTIVPVRLR